jgi:hypothetical protein
MDKTLNAGDIELLLECLGWSTQKLRDHPLDPEPEDLYKAELAIRKEKLARIEALMTKLRSIRDGS